MSPEKRELTEMNKFPGIKKLFLRADTNFLTRPEGVLRNANIKNKN